MDSTAMEDFPSVQEVMLEFRAGKMFSEGTRVIPDNRKGLIRIARGDEGLVHFQWLDRTLNVVEDDQIIFPDEAVFEKVNQSSGRVYILKFNTDDRKFFFWMQEPKVDEDSQICSSVNFHINRPLELGEGEPEVSVPLEMSEDMAEDDISSRAGNLIGSNLGADVTSDVTSSSGPVKLADLQRILSSIGPQDAGGDLEEGDLLSVAYSRKPYSDDFEGPSTKASDPRLVHYRSLSREKVYLIDGFGLGDILTPELILPLMETLPLEQRLASYLPEGQWSPEDIIELLQSPPFRQQVEAFTYVLRTGQIDLSQFGIDPSKYKLSVQSFLEALDDSVAKVSEPEEENKDLSSQMRSGSDAMDEGQ